MASIEKSQRVDLAQLEAEVTGHASRVGVTAEAVMRDYEFTAKAIEVLGAELIIALKRFEAMTTEGNDGAQKPFARKPGLSQ